MKLKYPALLAQKAAKKLQEAEAGSKTIVSALRDYEKAVCGPGWFDSQNPSPWQMSLQRLIGHLQSVRLLEYESNDNSTDQFKAIQQHQHTPSSQVIASS